MLKTKHAAEIIKCFKQYLLTLKFYELLENYLSIFESIQEVPVSKKFLLRKL